MGLPDIVIAFTRKALSTISVGTQGVVGIILKDDGVSGAVTMSGVEMIPEGLSEDNKAYLNRAFIGAPKKVIAYVLGSEAEDYNAAFKFFGKTRVNYLCAPPDADTEKAQSVTSWVKSQRKAAKRLPKAVVAGDTPDTEGAIVVKFTNGDTIKEGETTYTAAQFCSRIAGILAGLDLSQSATYYALPEITEIPEAEDEDVDGVIDAGCLTLYDTGSGIVIGRAVTSLTTVDATHTEDLKKIKIVAIQDLISMDIMDTINANYVGKYPNSYDNKCLLITAIMGYFAELERRQYLMAGHSTIEINVEKQKLYLESKGVDTSEMSEQEIKEANTDSHVFLKGSIGILDAIEDVDIIINKE